MSYCQFKSQIWPDTRITLQTIVCVMSFNKKYNIKLSFLDFRMWILFTYHMTQGNCAYMISTTWNLGKIEYIVFCIDSSENLFVLFIKNMSARFDLCACIIRLNLMRLLLDGIFNGFISNFKKQICVVKLG